MLVFPTRLFKPASMVPPQLVGGSVTGGVSLGGNAQYAETSGGGLWGVEFSEANLIHRAQYMAWLAMVDAQTNGGRAILVPICDRLHSPVNSQLTTTPFDDASLWDDGVAWDQAEVQAVVTAPAALRATSLTFDYTAPKPLIGSEPLSVLHAGLIYWRMHRVIRVVSGGLGTGDSTTVEIRPPLRAAVAVDTPLNFDSPRFVARMNGPASTSLDLLKFGKGSIRFIECFPASLD
jgi:hypothetical protein